MSDTDTGENKTPAELRVRILTDANTQLQEKIVLLEARNKAADVANARMAEIIDSQNRAQMYKDIRAAFDKKKLPDAELMALDSGALETLWNHSKLVRSPIASVKMDSNEGDEFDSRKGLTVPAKFLSQTKK